MCYQLYQQSKLFGKLPSEIAVLDDCLLDDIGRYYFNRGIYMFGQHVDARVEAAGTSRDPALAATQREREWERLMGFDMDESTTGFADPTADFDDPVMPESKVLATGF